MNKVKSGDLTIGDGTVKICIPVIGDSPQKCHEHALDIIDSHPDVIEFRADCPGTYYDRTLILETAKKIKELITPIPLLFTFRTTEHGGTKSLDKDDYIKLLQAVTENDIADIIDLEFPIVSKNLLNICIPKIVSLHLHSGSRLANAELDQIIEIGQNKNIIIKIALDIDSDDDLRYLKEISSALKESTEAPLIIIGMGEKGIDTRLDPGSYNSSVVFMKKDRESAPGQLDISDLEKIRF